MKKINIALAALILSSCATGKAIETGAKTAGQDALNCAEQTIASSASQIVPAILAILQMPSSNWKNQADMYAAAYTKQVTICAARNALAQLTAPVQSEANPVDPATVKNTAVAREHELEMEAGYSK